MNHHYRDITDKLGDPQWWDEYGVPRYCPFAPNEVADIYAHQVALLEILCQGCGRSFRVAMSSGRLETPLSRRISDHSIHYGDPPNAGCCPDGAAMNSEPQRIIEFWTRERAEWERQPKWEDALPA